MMGKCLFYNSGWVFFGVAPIQHNIFNKVVSKCLYIRRATFLKNF